MSQYVDLCHTREWRTEGTAGNHDLTKEAKIYKEGIFSSEGMNWEKEKTFPLEKGLRRYGGSGGNTVSWDVQA